MLSALVAHLILCNNAVNEKNPVLFHDAGGGHRNAAVALQTIVPSKNAIGK